MMPTRRARVVPSCAGGRERGGARPRRPGAGRSGAFAGRHPGAKPWLPYASMADPRPQGEGPSARRRCADPSASASATGCARGLW